MSKCTDCVVYKADDGSWWIQAWFDNGHEYNVPIEQLEGIKKQEPSNGQAK
jgi:hypothetical protein